MRAEGVDATEQTRDLVRRFVDAWFAADAEAMGTLLAHEATMHPPRSVAAPVEGRDRIATGFAGAAAGQHLRLDTVRRTVTSMLVDGTRAGVLVHLEAETHSGASYVNDYCWLFECRDAQVLRITEYADTLVAARLGFIPFRADAAQPGWLPADD